MKQVFFIIVLILVGVRLLWLDRIPVGMTHDELEYLLSAKTFVSQGTDISGTKFPKSLYKTNGEVELSLVPYVFLAPYLKIMPLNLFTARLFFVGLNLLTAVILYLLILNLFKNKTWAQWGMVAFLINPWSFYLSRVVSDSAFGLFFYLLGILVFVKSKWWISLIMFLLGFWSYQGAIPVLPFLVFILSFWNWDKGKYLLLSILVVLTIYFGVSVMNRESNLGTRMSGMRLMNVDKLTREVDEERRLVIDNSIVEFVSNKPVVWMKQMREKYLTIFSPEIWFVSGDPRATYKFGEHGLLYIVDIAFLVAGFMLIFNRFRKIFWGILAIILVAPAATMISSVEISVINRSFLLLPIFSILIGIGMSQMGRKLGVIAVMIIVGLGVFNFGYFYFFRFPILAHENFYLSERIIANYVKRLDTNQAVLIVTDKPREVKMELEFYGVNFRNLEIFDKYPQNLPENSVIIALAGKQKADLGIIEHHYGGALYTISGDTVCQDFSTDYWRRDYKMGDYLVEKMSTKEFCNRWIMRIVSN